MTTSQPNPLDSLPDADDCDYTQQPIEPAPSKCVRRLLPHNIALVEEVEKGNRCPTDSFDLMKILRHDLCYGYFSFDEKTKTYGKLVAWMAAEKARHGNCWFIHAYATNDYEGVSLPELVHGFAQEMGDNAKSVEIHITIPADRLTLRRHLITIGFDVTETIVEWFKDVYFDPPRLPPIDGIAMSLVW